MKSEIPPRLVVLLCHDNPAAKALERLLRDWGYQGVRGCEPDELAAKLRGVGAQLHGIIADLPVLEAVSLIGELATRGFVAKVLLLTEGPHGGARRAALRTGYAVMDKPASPARLQAWLESP